MFRAVPLACALVTGACSVVFVDAPPRPCTTSATAPVVDTAIGVLAAIGAVYFATSGRDDAVVAAAVEGTLAAGFGASAYVGFGRIARCRAGGAR